MSRVVKLSNLPGVRCRVSGLGHHQIVVNGRTGEIQGDRPYSFWKIALFVATILLLVLLISLVFELFSSA